MSSAKIIITMFLALAICQPLWAAKIATAEMKNDTLRDLKVNFSLEIPKNWKVKTFKEEVDEPELLRAILQQKNYQINQEAKNLAGDYTIPEIQFFARKDTLSAAGFITRLINDINLRSSEDDIINQLNLLLMGEYVTTQQVSLGGQPATQAFFKRNWERQMTAEADDPHYRQHGGLIVRKVNDVHEVYALNYQDYLIVIQANVEFEFYQAVKEEVDKMLLTLAFPGSGGNAADK